ncbi:MAG: hypothetical protein AB4352_21275 [Hormoscilla sp.]
MTEKTIIKTITFANYASEIVPVYLARQHSKVLSLKVQSRLPSYRLHQYPFSLSFDDTDELNRARITTYNCEHTQVLINLFLMDYKRWNLIRSEPVVNYGGVIETLVIEPYISDFCYFVLQRGFAIGIHIQCLEHPLMPGDVITIIGHAETAEESAPVADLIPSPENIYFAAPSLPLPKPRGGFILDAYPDAIAGFSLRKLTEHYNGPALRARRADGVDADIGFDGDRLDVAQLFDFASGSSVHGHVEVLVWYDQTGRYGHLYAPDLSLDEKRPLIMSYSNRRGYKIYSDALGYKIKNGEQVRDDRYRDLPYMEFQRGSFLRGAEGVRILGDASRRLVVVAGRFGFGEPYLCGFGGTESPQFYGLSFFRRSGRPSRTMKVFLTNGRDGNSLSLRYGSTNIICATYYQKSKINHLSLNGGADVGGDVDMSSEFLLETIDGPLAVGATSFPVPIEQQRQGDFACYELLLWGQINPTDNWTPGRDTHWDLAIDMDIFYPTFEPFSRRYVRPGGRVYDVQNIN